MSLIKIIVEGGGNKTADRACRSAFTRFFSNAGIDVHYLQVHPVGNDAKAYDIFSKEMNNSANTNLVLLVDSHREVSDEFQSDDDIRNWRPWEHLKNSHNWKKPNNAEDSQCHLMVRCMETWLIADPQAVEKHFSASISPEDRKKFEGNIERIHCPTQELRQIARGYRKLNNKYHKIDDGLKLLAKIDPQKLIGKSLWAQRLIEELKQRTQFLAGIL